MGELRSYDVLEVNPLKPSKTLPQLPCPLPLRRTCTRTHAHSCSSTPQTPSPYRRLLLLEHSPLTTSRPSPRHHLHLRPPPSVTSPASHLPPPRSVRRVLRVRHAAHRRSRRLRARQRASAARDHRGLGRHPLPPPASSFYFTSRQLSVFQGFFSLCSTVLSFPFLFLFSLVVNCPPRLFERGGRSCSQFLPVTCPLTASSPVRRRTLSATVFKARLVRPGARPYAQRPRQRCRLQGLR